MSRKDYIAIAGILRNADFGPVTTTGSVVTPTDRRLALAQALSDHFATDNPRFDRARFVHAAMLDTEFPTESYVVVENTPGYLPESEPEEFDSYTDAVAFAKELADSLVAAGYQCDASVASRDNFYAIRATRPDNPNDLGRVIEVIRADS